MTRQELMTTTFAEIAPHYNQFAYLAQLTAKELCQRLQLMKIAPKRILDSGCGTGINFAVLRQYYPKAVIMGADLVREMLAHSVIPKELRLICDNEQLSLASHSVDLVSANLLLPWCDLNQLLSEYQRILTDNGLLLLTTLGPNSLQELTAKPPATFIDMHDLGDLLCKHGFNDPVIEVENLTFSYNDSDLLWQELHHLGLDCLVELEADIMATTKSIDVSFEIIYAHAWQGIGKPKNQDNEEVMIPLSTIKRRSDYHFD